MTPASPDASSAPNALVVVAILLVGLALVAHPLYLWPHYKPTPWSVSGVEQVDGNPEDGVVAYERLPRDARQAFDAAREGDRARLWSGEHGHAIQALREHRVVRYEGRAYRYHLVHADTTHLATGLVRGWLTTVGVLLVALGGLVHLTGRWRPLSPRRSLLLPLAVLLGIALTQTYDILYSGVSRPLPLPVGPVAVLPFAVGFVAVGSLLRREGRRVLGAVFGLGIGLLLGLPIVTGAGLSGAFFVGAGLVVVCGPFLGLGYGLTASS